MASTLLLLTLGASTICSTSALNFELGPGRQECFYEELHTGTNVTGAFSVVRGSHRDVDVFLRGPPNKTVELYRARREGEGTFHITVANHGLHEVCFSNKMSVMAHKYVKFILDVEGEDRRDLDSVAKRAHVDKVEDQIAVLMRKVKDLEFKQATNRQLHDRHYGVVEDTWSSVLLWVAFQGGCALFLCLLHMAYIQQLLSRRRHTLAV